MSDRRDEQGIGPMANATKAIVVRPHGQMLGLDVARFFAAALVMVYHMGAYAWQAPFSTAGRAFGDAAQFPGLFPWTWFGWVSVEIFFVISGFVIAYSAEHATPWSFLRSRILRLVPAVWVCATLTMLVSFAIGRMGSGRHVLHAYLDGVLFWPFEPWIDGVYWTLGVEIAFYAVILLLLWRGRFNKVGLVCGGIGTASALFWLVTLAEPHLAAVAARRAAELTLLRHGCFFALGVFLWLTLIKGPTAGRLSIIALCLVASFIEIGDASDIFLAQMDRHEAPLVPRLVFLGCVLSIAVSVRWNERLRDLLGGAGCRLARTLGLMTYPLYLMHNVNGSALTHLLARSAGFAPYAALTASWAAMLLVSFAIVRGPEPIVRRILVAVLAVLRERAWRRVGDRQKSVAAVEGLIAEPAK